jgi:hypothetical protein
MKTTDDDEPLVVLVLFVLAGLCVLAGLIQGMQMPGLGGILFGCLAGASAGLGFWALAVIIRLLYKIERNTRR